MHKQLHPYGCGLYAVANALNLSLDFITPERLEASKAGNNIGQLSKWLQESGADLYLQPIFFDRSGKNSQYLLSLVELKDSCKYLPLIFLVKLPGSDLEHVIAGQLTDQGILCIYDSAKDVCFATFFSRLTLHYEKVFAMFTFADCATGHDAFIG